MGVKKDQPMASLVSDDDQYINTVEKFYPFVVGRPPASDSYSSMGSDFQSIHHIIRVCLTLDNSNPQELFLYIRTIRDFLDRHERRFMRTIGLHPDFVPTIPPINRGMLDEIAAKRDVRDIPILTRILAVILAAVSIENSLKAHTQLKPISCPQRTEFEEFQRHAGTIFKADCRNRYILDGSDVQCKKVINFIERRQDILRYLLSGELWCITKISFQNAEDADSNRSDNRFTMLLVVGYIIIAQLRGKHSSTNYPIHLWEMLSPA